MKKVIVALISAVFVSSGYAELLGDGGFEAGSSVWILYENAQIEEWAARSGSSGLAFYGWESQGGAYCDINGGSGSNYVFSIWGLEDTDFSNSLEVEMKIELFTAGEDKLAEFSQTVTGTTEWAQYTISAPSSPGTAIIRIVLAYSGTAGDAGAFKWDDAELTATSVDSYTNTHYVSSSGSAIYPYTNWAMASRTIYGAVNAADHGDEVIVGDGVYAEGIQIPVNRAIHIHSENGPAACHVTGEDTHRGFYISDPGATVEGFTIRNGRAAQYSNTCYGGGVLMPNGGVLRDCIIADNVVTGYVQGAPGNYLYCYGSGVYCANTARVENCVIYNNTAQRGESAGAGIYATGSVTISKCTVFSNRADGGVNSYYLGKGGYGSGIYAVNQVTIEDSTVYDNTATCQNSMYPGVSLGAGIYCTDNGMINRCQIYGNILYGGGYSLRGYGGGRGAGVYVAWGSVLKNSLVRDNRALKTDAMTSSHGAGVYAYGDLTKILNNTIVDNYAEAETGGDTFGGGLYADNDVEIANCVVVSNTATADYGYRDCYIKTNCVVTHCNILAGYLPECPGRITESPLFVDYAADDFSLQSSSPCIDAGVSTECATDLWNMPRPLDGNGDSVPAYDIGACERLAESADSDADGMSDADELFAGTDPTSASSVFAVQMDEASDWTPGSGITIHWPAVYGKKYTLFRAESLFAEFVPVATGMVSALNVNSCTYTDLAATNQAYYYRIKLESIPGE